MSDLAERVRILEAWKTGDGARGAEIRLQDSECKIAQIEKQLMEIKSQQEDFMNCDDMNALADQLKADIVLAIRTEKKKGIEKLKAWAPYFAAACTLVAAILVTVLSH